MDVEKDYRREWIKERIMAYMGIEDEIYFEEMMSANDEDLEDKLQLFLDDDIVSQSQDDLHKKLFYVCKTYCDRLFEEEIFVQELVIRPPPPLAVVAKSEIAVAPGKKGKKGKGKDKGSSKGDSDKGSKKKSGKVTPESRLEAASEGEEEEEEEEEEMEYEEGSIFETEEVEIMKEVQVIVPSETGESESPEPPSEATTVASEQRAETPSPTAGKSEKGGKDKKGKKGKGKKRGKEVALPEPEPEPEPEYITVKKIIQKIKKSPKLQGEFGSVDGDTALPDTRYIYIMRLSEHGIPKIESMEDARAEMASFFLIGTITSNFLNSMEQHLTRSKLPLVKEQFREPKISEYDGSEKVEGEPARHSQLQIKRPSDFRRFSLSVTKKEKVKESPPKTEMNTPTKSVIIDDIEKLIEMVKWCIVHVEGDVQLQVVNIPQLTNPDVSDEEIISNTEIIQQLEEVVMSWESHIIKVIETELAKEPVGNGPVPEYEYWNERQAALSNVVEQLKKKIILRILNLLEKAESQIPSGFIYFKMDLMKYYVEARENTKFLSSIYRHLRNITDTTFFKDITDCLPNLMDGLHMIWALSRFYCTDEIMVPLFERIAWMLRYKVETILNIDTLFDNPPLVVAQLTKNAKIMLETWKNTYLKTRDKIEEIGKSNRWEFDKIKLFSETDYEAIVCGDLHEVATIMRHFNNIFGPELKSIINDPQQIDIVTKQVEQLVIPIQMAEFNHYNKEYKENWEAVMAEVHKQVQQLDYKAKFFINISFKILKSSEEALEMLIKFKHIETRQSIQKQLLTKFDGIMDFFTKEVIQIEDIFMRNRRNPPLCRNHPPHAGAIFWARMLFNRLKKPVLTFQKVEELKGSVKKIEAFEQYLIVARTLKTYEQNKYDQWVEIIMPAVTNAFNKNILKVVNILFTKGIPSGLKQESPERESDTDNASTAKKGAQKLATVATSMKWVVTKKGQGKSMLEKLQSQQATWAEMIGNNVMPEQNLRFEVNFNMEVFNIVDEAKLMEKLGFTLPAEVVRAALQKDRVYQDIDSVKAMLQTYNRIVDQLTMPELYFLRTHLQEVERNIATGLFRMTWDTLSIQDYSNSCSTLLISLEGMVEQIKDFSNSMETRIGSLGKFDLFHFETLKGVILSCKEYFERVTDERTDGVCQMKEIYDNINPVLLKLEDMVLHTTTGKSSKMSDYYEFWENQIYMSLTSMTVENMRRFNDSLCGKIPVFQVDILLVEPELSMKPTATEMYNIIIRSAKDFLQRLKSFPRWMKGMCWYCKPQKLISSDEYYLFSFYEDVMQNQTITEYSTKIQSSIQNIIMSIHKYLQKYENFQLQNSVNAMNR